MPSGDLIPGERDLSEPASSEVQFALVIARMIDTVKNSPEDMRQAVYDLARYKLQEQFTYADAPDVRRTEQALETAIRGVEAFSRQQGRLPAPPPPASPGEPALAPAPATRRLAAPEPVPQPRPRPGPDIDPAPTSRASATVRAPRAPGAAAPWPYVRRTAMLVAILVVALVAVRERGRLADAIHRLPRLEWQNAAAPPPMPVAAAPAPPLPAKPAPLRPKDYGVYAVGPDSLAELELLPGRPPDIRVAVSAAIKTPSRTSLPNGHPKFLIFRRDVVASISDRADVRIIARVAREFSPEAAGRTPEGDGTWVIRNVAFPFRASPLADDPDMVELHSEDPDLDLSPGRYALVLKNQSYDFTVEGRITDPRQCIERIVSANGTYYSDCRQP